MFRTTFFAVLVLLSTSQIVSANSLSEYKECVKWCQVEIDKQAGLTYYDAGKHKTELLKPFMSVLSACVDGCENFTK